MATIKLQNDKVVLKDGKVSCECCVTCQCGDLTLDELIENFESLANDQGRPVDNYSPPPGNKARFRLSKACLAFLCRSVSTAGTKPVICSQVFGDPAVDLTSAIFQKYGQKENNPQITSVEGNGTYLYIFSFFAWRSSYSFWAEQRGMTPNPPIGETIYVYSVPVYNIEYIKIG